MVNYGTFAPLIKVYGVLRKVFCADPVGFSSIYIRYKVKQVENIHSIGMPQKLATVNLIGPLYQNNINVIQNKNWQNLKDDSPRSVTLLTKGRPADFSCEFCEIFLTKF